MVNKFKAEKTEYNGVMYDSKGEARLAMLLEQTLKKGEVLERQVPLRFEINGKLMFTHKVDFKIGNTYYEFKGKALSMWKLKVKILLATYPDLDYILVQDNRRGGYEFTKLNLSNLRKIKVRK